LVTSIKKIKIEEEEEYGSLLNEGEVINRIFKQRMIRRNKNCLVVTTGPTGSGKSYSNLRIAELWYRNEFDEDFPIDNICFGVLELLKRIRDPKKKLRRGELFILEEAGTSMGSLDFMSKTSKIFAYVLQSFRSLNLALLMNLPYYTMLNKQARELVHIQLETWKIEPAEKQSYLKPYIMQTNPTSGKLYRHFPKLVVDHTMETIHYIKYGLPSKELAEKYESAKKNFVMETIDDGINEIERMKNPNGKVESAGVDDDEFKKQIELRKKIPPLPKLQFAVWDQWQKGVYRPKDIAEILGITSGTVTNAVIGLKKKGLYPPYVPGAVVCKKCDDKNKKIDAETHKTPSNGQKP